MEFRAGLSDASPLMKKKCARDLSRSCSISASILAQLQEQRRCGEVELKQILISRLHYVAGELRSCACRGWTNRIMYTLYLKEIKIKTGPRRRNLKLAEICKCVCWSAASVPAELAGEEIRERQRIIIFFLPFLIVAFWPRCLCEVSS